jgi:hypothetical protein
LVVSFCIVLNFCSKITTSYNHFKSKKGERLNSPLSG